MEGPQLEILKKQMEFLENFSKILKFMEKTMLSAQEMTVMGIFKKFYYLADRPFIVPNVRPSDNKYLLTPTHVGVI